MHRLSPLFLLMDQIGGRKSMDERWLKQSALKEAIPPLSDWEKAILCPTRHLILKHTKACNPSSPVLK